VSVLFINFPAVPVPLADLLLLAADDGSDFLLFLIGPYLFLLELGLHYHPFLPSESLMVLHPHYRGRLSIRSVPPNKTVLKLGVLEHLILVVAIEFSFFCKVP
jgi:hypothetical protein